MNPGPADSTSASLLGRLRRSPADEGAWREFVARYGRRIFHWCRQWGLQDADAEDVTQNVLAVLAERLRSFEYDAQRSFRAWLKTVAHHAWGKHAARLARPGRGAGEAEAPSPLATVEARDDLAARLEAELDRELLDLAMLRVAHRVEPQTWQAFTLTAIDGLSGADAAARLGVPVAMVYVGRSRIQKMLKEELRLLEAGE
ncbi:MAG TPA: sigma-70 family RNA polymerase sigma factor [Gemmataceae bacterium]|jgi:RNA polymerase sigma-70 factor (ECF subfamily)|nr:sigma-70 family RNA polymerase sigma factor [Gemmataceae bacterium]